MKKKIIFIVGIMIVLVIAVLFSVFRPEWKVLGNMSKNVPEVKTSSTDFSFQGEAGVRIMVSLRTTVKAGVVDFILTDSKGNLIEEFDYADALETFVVLENDDIYTMTASYQDFSGKFSAKVRIKRF
ncbi:MAG: hypothetical protein LBM69_07470 [Lachnospiraceae bacterium]|jgi:hypothetical protein|nr:hypothetical protein [Lachnospiraceae bacterium]